MNRKHRFPLPAAAATLAVLIAFSAAPRPAAAFDDDGERAIDFVPERVSLVVGANTRNFFDSQQFQEFFEANGGADIRSNLRLVKALTGVHPMDDIDEAVFFMNLDDNSLGAVVRGNFDQALFLNFLRSNDEYSAYQAGNSQPAHTWSDPDEGTRYGMFASDDAFVVTTSKEMLDSCLEARSDFAKSFAGTRGAGLIPARAKKVAFWAALASTPSELQEMLQVTAASATVALQGDSLVLGATIQIENDQNAEQWISMIRGFLALAQIQQESPELAEIANSVRLDKTRGGGNSIQAEVAFNFSALPSLAQALGLQ
jgi:hypothetical protein